MKRTRKIISVILALIMMLCMSPLSGLTAVMSFAAPVTEDTAGNMSDVIFNVPETIYLKPETSNTASVFQYYVDRGLGETGALRTGENTNGYIYFNCPGASSVSSLTCQTVTSTGAVSADITSRITINNSGSGSNYKAVTITAGSLPTALSNTGYQTLKWTIKYVKDGKTCTATNYSVCYSPMTSAAAAATAAGYNGQNFMGITEGDFVFRQTTWISGIHSISNAPGGDWHGGIPSPLVNPTSYVVKTSEYAEESFIESSLSGATGYFKRDDNVSFSGGTAYITVDSSRYSTLSSVPNLQLGMDFNGLGTDYPSHAFSLGMRIGAYPGTVSEQKSNVANFPSISDKASVLNNDQSGYIGRHGGYKFNFPCSVGILVVRSEAYGYSHKSGSDDSRSSVGYINLNVTPVDKSGVRGSIGSAVSKGLQPADFNGSGWTNYELQLQKACEKLGQVTNTNTDVSALNSIVGNTGSGGEPSPSARITVVATPEYSLSNQSNNFITGTLGGTVSGGGVYTPGQQVTLSASPASGYRFEGWYENYSKRSSSLTWTFAAPTLQNGQTSSVLNISARFSSINQNPNDDPDDGSLSISVSAASNNSSDQSQYYIGSTGGTVSGSGNYNSGDTATLRAYASTGYYFDGWYSGLRSSFSGVNPVSMNPTMSVAVSGNASYTAKFSLTSLSVLSRRNTLDSPTVWEQGTGGSAGWSTVTYVSGSVTGSGLSAGSTTYYVGVGNTIKLNAEAEPGYYFVGWYTSMSGWDTDSDANLVSTDAEYTFIMPAGNPVYYARFDVDLPAALDKALDDVPPIKTCYTDESMGELQAVLEEIYDGTEDLTDEELADLIARLNEAIANLEIRTHEVNVPDNCTSTQTEVEGVNYKLATISAPQTNANGDKFVYWTDSYGNIVSTYRTYQFYIGNDADYTPVYASPAEYDQMRAEALITSRVLDVKNNGDGNLVFLAEHSVSGAAELNGHGMIITTNPDYADAEMLVRGSDSDDVIDFQAQKTRNSKTGMIQVCANVTGDTVWARTYVVDTEGVVHYGLIQSYDVANIPSGGPVVTDSAEFDIVNEEIPVEEEPAEESEGILTMLLNIIRTLIQRFDVILKGILSLIK
ncbi:MAG: hypothetical protein IJU45_06420 [Clostridia bacterium]|nr:hypothetical protein [Clostridia bacterium]